MVRMEGMGVMYRIQKSMQEGMFPGEELISAAMILVAGALLLTPGFFTDIIGFLMVIPVTRKYITNIIKKYIKKNMSNDDIHINRF